ncbi:MAG: P-II family nitrogen regulator [Saprospiraceae bacterium]
MKKIEAIVRLSRFDRIRDALAEIGVKFFTLSEVKGFGLQKGKQLTYRGSVYDADYIARLQLDILCEADKVDAIVETIVSSGRTGEVGDGKVMVYDIQQIVRIRNGERDEHAI